MLNPYQCKRAREATDKNDPDEEIIEQFDALTDNDKIEIINDLLVIMKSDEFPPSLNDWRELSEKGYWITHPVLFCVFMEWKSKNQYNTK